MQQSSKADVIFAARCLARRLHSGVLATHSLSVKGYPFGSVTPYLMTQTGEFIIYASDIAQHTRNMKANAKVSLCIHDGTADDSQANARLTVLGDAVAIGTEPEEAEAYFTLFAKARAYQNTHDFAFYRIAPTRLRYIGGFGEIHWFAANEWHYPQQEWVANIDGMIVHMHDDHADALALMVNLQHQLNCREGEVKMLSAYAEGFHVQTPNEVLFIAYDQPCLGNYSVRAAMVKLTQQAREKLQGSVTKVA